MIDMPVCFTDLLFDIIEGAVCLWIIVGVNEMNEQVGKVMDPFVLVCDSHDIILSRDGLGPTWAPEQHAAIATCPINKVITQKEADVSDVRRPKPLCADMTSAT